MKLRRGFKRLLLGTAAALYATGLAVWILGRFFLVDFGDGPEPSPLKTRVLHAHSVLGLLFLILFGYLWRDHVEPGLRRSRKRRSGVAVSSVFAVLFLTVPVLFYASGDAARARAAAVHAWLGAAALAPVLLHLRARRS